MSTYLENVIKGAGGHAAPAENLDFEKEESTEDEYELDFNEEDLAVIEELQSLDDGEDFDSYDPILSDGMMLVPEEADLASAILEVVDKYGKFNDDNTGVWAGYNSAEENAENAAIGVKCGNCVFWQSPNGCQIIVAETEEGGLCRFAILPDGAVTATAGSKPAPKKDQIKGSKKNKKGSAASGKGVKFSKKIEEALSKKAKDHNEKAPDGRKTSLRTLKAVYRRGAGAFSTSHRPDQNRNSWAMARVNAFLKLLKSGKPKNAKYVTDNDLLPASHPRSTKNSASITAAADPCWDGYVQVGMKTKNGNRVPNCVPSSATIGYLVETANSEFGESRHVSAETAYEIARKAVDKYDYLPDEELYDAVMWELQNFLDYATSGESEYKEEFSLYSEYLPEGHPNTKAALAASAAWISGAPDLDEKSRDAIVTAFSETEDYLAATHSTTRLRALISSGELSVKTLKHLKTIVEQYPKVD